MTEKLDKELLKKIDSMSFEDALGRLEDLVREMEDGSTTLEDMILRFEEGSILASACQAKLDKLRKKIEILRKDSRTGNLVWGSFAGDEEEKEEEKDPSLFSATPPPSPAPARRKRTPAPPPPPPEEEGVEEDLPF